MLEVSAVRRRVLPLAMRTFKWLNMQNAISGFFVTLFGVWAAFWLTGIGQREDTNIATRQRLHLAHFEAEQNALLAQSVFRYEPLTNSVDAILKRPSVIVVETVLTDSNLPSYLKHDKLSMLLTYLESLHDLTEALDWYSNYRLLNIAQDGTNSRIIIATLREKAATVLAASFAVMSDLDSYADPADWGPKTLESNQQRIERLRRLAIQGNLRMSDDPVVRDITRKTVQQSAHTYGSSGAGSPSAHP